MRATFDGAGAQLAAELYGLCYSSTIEPRGIKRGDDVRLLQRRDLREARGVCVLCPYQPTEHACRAARAPRARSTVFSRGEVFFSLSFPLPNIPYPKSLILNCEHDCARCV